MALALENQDTSLETDNSPSVPDDGNPFANIPLLDENDNPIPEAEKADEAGDEEADDEAGDDADEPKELVLSDELEIKIDDETSIKGGEIKQLIQLRENYTQQRMQDTAKVREIEQTAHQTFARRTGEQVEFTVQMFGALESVALGGYTREQVNQLWRTDPETANILSTRINQIDAMAPGVAKEVKRMIADAEESNKRAEASKAIQEEQSMHLELRKLAGEKWLTGFAAKAQAYYEKNGIPVSEANSLKYAGQLKILRQSMLYEEAMARQKSGKQAPNVVQMRPGSNPGNGRVNQIKQANSLYESAKSGSKEAAGRYFRMAIPTLKD